MDWAHLDNSPALIRSLLDGRGVALKKRWGQNFMISATARERIVGLLEGRAGEQVWEIGPGLGAITALLVDSGYAVTVFEVDHGLIGILSERFGDRIRVVPGDAVRTLRLDRARPDIIVGNLPYRSAAAIVAVLLESGTASRRLVFTVQKEVALRMAAAPGTADYSAFSVVCALTCLVRHAGTLAAGNFYPRPGVVSSVVVMEPRRHDPVAVGAATVAARSLFASRRKTVWNNLPRLASDVGVALDDAAAAMDRCGIPRGARAEELEPGRYLQLAIELSTVRPTPG